MRVRRSDQFRGRCVGVESSELVDGLLLVGQLEGGSFVWLGLEPCIQRVVEARLSVPKLRQQCDVECGHHSVVLVDQVVAVEHVETVPWAVKGKNTDSFSRLELDGILQTSRLIGKHAATTSSTTNDLHVDQMDVNRVNGWATSMAKLPEFGSALWWFGEDAVVHIRERNAVDSPSCTATTELEREGVVDSCARGRVVDVGVQCGCDDAVVGGITDTVANDESHDLIGIREGGRSSGSEGVEHCKVLSSEAGEVHDNLVTLAHRHDEGVCRHRGAEQTRIGSNDLEVNVGTGGVLKTKIVCAAQ